MTNDPVRDIEDAHEYARVFDHTSQWYRQDPAAALRRLRQECPVARSETNGGFYIASRYDDVARIARDDETFSSRWEPAGPFMGVSAQTPKHHRSGFIDMDPPESTHYRELISHLFAPPAVEQATPFIRQTASDAIDQFIDDGATDVVTEYAEVIPAMTTMHILGVPTHDWREYVEYFHENSGVPTSAPGFKERHGPDNFVIRSLRDLIIDRRADPQDDGLTVLATALAEGEPLDLDLAAEIGALLMSGGLDTTAALLSNTILYVSEHPELRERLIGSPELRRSSCEEFLRYFAPVQNLARTVTKPCELGGTTLQPGDRVMISWASANRDRFQFSDPDDIRLDRFPNRHQAFGLGSHRCVGSTLARRMFEVGITEFLTRLPDYWVLTDKATRYASLGSNNGWLSMPIEFPPGGSAPLGR